MGRWAWSSDALDFDGDGFLDLYVANGMLTRAGGAEDLDGFFWRQVVARSPQARVTGTPYDDAWRALNQRLVTSSIASHQRNVMLRNDGQGGFDEVSGTVGLDLDQDGRSFGVLDLDGDGDPDLVILAARQAPQAARVPKRLRGDSRGARAPAQGRRAQQPRRDRRARERRDRRHAARTGRRGLRLPLAALQGAAVRPRPSRRCPTLTVDWPSGSSRSSPTCRSTAGFGWTRAGSCGRAVPRRLPRFGRRRAGARAAVPAPRGSTSRSGARFSLPTCGRDALARRASGSSRRAARVDAARAKATAAPRTASGSRALAAAGIGALARRVDAERPQIEAAASGMGTLPVVLASPELALSYAILNRHLFMNRQDLRLPTAFLLDPESRVVKAYRDGVDAAQIARDAGQIQVPPAERLSRAVPFAGTLYGPPGRRNYVPYGHELLDQGLDSVALTAFERAAQSDPNSSTLYRLGSLLLKSGQPEKARAALERALVKQPDLAEASNDLGTLLAQGGDVEAAILRFRAALQSAPDYPDALNNLGYALLLTGKDAEARSLYEKALALQPDFPEALNNLGMLLGRGGDLGAAEARFREALARRPGYGEAANNLALVLVARGDEAAAVRLLEGFLAADPAFESAYVTLAKIHLAAGRNREAAAALERLLQRNPTHHLGRELLGSIR
jgi:Tfp pilus assembly protein PilF